MEPRKVGLPLFLAIDVSYSEDENAERPEHAEDSENFELAINNIDHVEEEVDEKMQDTRNNQHSNAHETFEIVKLSPKLQEAQQAPSKGERESTPEKALQTSSHTLANSSRPHPHMYTCLRQRVQELEERLLGYENLFNSVGEMDAECDDDDNEDYDDNDAQTNVQVLKDIRTPAKTPKTFKIRYATPHFPAKEPIKQLLKDKEDLRKTKNTYRCL
ncbi:hypothetical protein E3P81_01109 [Wallemia ichthyophaga]|nr:hypothetical protein E3P97_01110 [Wallemia ichthyophaga]TIB34395.1 hypothetical protein E3P85_00859 [Wallemia ichthyophaga]TIB48838.1 hypothetical protein E3P82_01108 [Wallemia ichthyophaga]TIB52732.1 hypothetical protein E3P81_01109 [Wallemia ichthyophaga]TIB55468.1 hypothetical protein E3P80_01109 [Wallemia ichthyophaga]